MKALILNSGIGKRMGELTLRTNKCMATIDGDITIIDRQIMLLSKMGVQQVVITTGPFAQELERYVTNKYKDIHFEFVHNNKYDSTNYIYSIYLARDILNDDIILMHGDLVFDELVLESIMKSQHSSMVIDTTLPLPEKDFKAVVSDSKIVKVGIEFFDNAYAAQPLYVLKQKDWEIWLNSIILFCEQGNTGVYAEQALNEVTNQIEISTFDVKGLLCGEIDNLDDLEIIRKKLKN